MQKQTAPAATGAMSKNLESARHANGNTGAARVSTGKPVYSNGRPCGFIRGNTFVRKFDSARHILHRRQAIALAVDVLQQIAGVDHVQLIDETGREFWLTPAEIREHGYPLNDPHYGAQTVIPLRWWRPTRDIVTADEPQADRPPEWSQDKLL